MSELRRYPDYKDSGVPWLGDIPSHWEAMSLKFSLSMPITDGPHETPEILLEGIPFISAEAVKKDKLDFNKKRGYISESDHEKYSKKYHPQRGDVYMVKSGATTGNVARVETDEVFNIWSPLAVMRPNIELISTDYLFYILKSTYFNISVQLKWNMGTQQNIGMGVLSNIKIIIPDIDEQQAIVNFLDDKLDHIDTLISKQQQLIEKLAEQRSAVITHAVTKGLDPDVSMKDSGVEWLGEIPEHWKVTKLKYYFDVQLGKMLQPNSTSSDDFEVNYLKAMHVQWDNVKVIDLPQMWCNERELEKYEVYNGDLLICEGGEVGRSALIRDLEGTTIIQNALHRLRSTNSGDVRYLDYLIRHIADSEWFSILCNKATIAHLTGDKLANTFITLPPLTEQIKIINYLDSQTQKIDEMSESNKSIITKLQEYRAALITQAVTGKIDVRHLNQQAS